MAGQGGLETGVGGGVDSGGEAGSESLGGAPPLVAEATCLEHEDCLAVCQANGWPSAHCYGSSVRFCACDSSGDGPTCSKGTTEGCPEGTACRTTHQCLPYGDGAQGDPCNNGDECAPGYICTGFGNPLPNGESTACTQFCDAQDAPPGCDCVGGSCLGRLGLYDFSCDFPNGTPCNQSTFAGTTSGHIVGPNEIAPGSVYIVTASSLDGENIDLEVCADTTCAGDHVCESNGAGGSETCFLQATEEALDVYLVNRSGEAATVKVDVEADAMSEHKLEYVQSFSSLQANRYVRLWVTGLTPAISYELSVTTTNGRDINLTVSNDLHGEDELCSEDALAGAAACTLAVTRASVWVLLSDTSGIGDNYTFKVTAQ